MVTLPWLAWAVWLANAPTALSQFNYTARFTLDSLDGMVDLDGASQWWSENMAWTRDEETGYRTRVSPRRFGEAGLWFVGTGFKVNGLGSWIDGEPDEFSKEPMIGKLQYANRKQPQPIPGYINGSTEQNPDRFSNTSLQLAAYELTLKYFPNANFEFHNLTIDVPIRTQA